MRKRKLFPDIFPIGALYSMSTYDIWKYANGYSGFVSMPSYNSLRVLSHRANINFFSFLKNYPLKSRKILIRIIYEHRTM